MYENPTICTTCQGICCKYYPGFYHPSQLGNTHQEIKKTLISMIKTGNFSIDRWEGDPRPDGHLDHVLMLRPRGRNKPVIHYPFFEPTFCIFLDLIGCILQPPDRPMQCQQLEPTRDHQCIEHNKIGDTAKHEAALLWATHQPEMLIAFRIAEDMGEKGGNKL
jgi:hypothetical protein